MQKIALILLFILLTSNAFAIEELTKEQFENQSTQNAQIQTINVMKTDIINEIGSATNYLDAQIKQIRQRFYLLFIGAFLSIQSIFFIVINTSLINPILQARKQSTELTDLELFKQKEMLALQKVNSWKKFYYFGLLVGLLLVTAGVFI